MRRTVVLDVVGLTQPLLGTHTPNLARFAAAGSRVVKIDAPTPAVTCSAQATYLTGELPSRHGIVGNGWYFRDLNEIWLWRQSNRLVQGDKIWDVARRRDPSFTCANTFWWYAMATRADFSLTPRPLYLKDGAKLPDFYSDPPELHDELHDRLGTFPLFHFWGPNTGIVSSKWIANSAKALEEKYSPTLQLVYLPHLDYCLQRVGPEGDVAVDLAEIDAVCGELIDFFQDRDCRVIVLSEYGITPVTRVVHPNRILRDAGMLGIKVDLGLEYLDPGRCRALAVSDHQISHVYVDDPADVDAVRELFEGIPGVAAVLDDDGKRAFGLDHERAGELVLLAESDSWFTYYFWNDDAVAPEYARMVDIHGKPGYDPCELFVDPQLTFPIARIAGTLAKKALGFRYKMSVTPLDASLVKGSHGVTAGTPHDTPILISSDPDLLDSDRLPATSVRDLMLEHLFHD